MCSRDPEVPKTHEPRNMMVLVRIDDKLIHSQVIWGWVRALKATCIVVANDEAARDELRKRLLTTAVLSVGAPEEAPIVKIFSLAEAARDLKYQKPKERSILVISRPSDAVRLLEKGVPIEGISVGWMSSLPGKEQIFDTVSVDEEDIEAFRELLSRDVSVKYPVSPSHSQLDMADSIG